MVFAVFSGWWDRQERQAIAYLMAENPHLGLTGTHLQLSIPVDVTCRAGEYGGGYLMSIWDGPTDPRVTVDVWLLQDGDRLLILTRGVRGNPPAEMLDSLNRTLDTLRLVATP